jgi:hypothetical protein
MAKIKRTRNKSGNKPRQGHKLVWFTLIIIAIPCVIVAYVLLSSVGGQSKPVTGSRFSSEDLTPEITNTNVRDLESSLGSIENVESVTVNLLSATLRVHLNLVDEATDDVAQTALNSAYDIVNQQLPIDTYFTNTDTAKMYDLEIDAYNYLIDDTHTEDGWTYLKLTKTGAGSAVTDNMTVAKDSDLASQLESSSESLQAAAAAAEESSDDGD